MSEVEVKDTIVLAFRLPRADHLTLVGRAKPNESMSDLLRRVTYDFLKKKPKKA
jgi:hypothetical protein